MLGRRDLGRGDLHESRVGDVALDRANVLADDRLRLVEFRLPAAGYENVGSLLDELLCRCEASGSSSSCGISPAVRGGSASFGGFGGSQPKDAHPGTQGDGSGWRRGPAGVP